MVFFDLDGTLANTKSLGPGMREPRQLLEPGLGRQPDWQWCDDVSNLPGDLISRGYLVSIATRAPLPYASTLLHLCGIDAHFLMTSCGSGLAKASVIKDQLASIGVAPTDAIYVGDEPEDEQVASHAGVHYADVVTLRSGELRRSLLTAPPGRPQAAVERVLEHAPAFTRGIIRAGGLTVDAQSASERLATSIREGVPDEHLHNELMNVLFQHGDISPQERAALCYFTLQARPGITSRTTLQHGLLCGATPENARCLIRNTREFFSMRPTLLTKSELRRDPEIRQRLLTSLSRVFPARTGHLPVDEARIPFRFLQTYNVNFGSVLKETKNYGGAFGSRFRSGPRVQLGRVDLIADMMASAITTRPNVPIVPVPASPYSPQQPGEVSNRLALLVATRTGGSVLPLLRRTGDEFTLTDHATGGEVVLLDDQTTRGTTVIGAAHLLHRAGFNIREIISYSASPPAISLAGATPHHRSDICGFESVAEWLGVHCDC